MHISYTAHDSKNSTSSSNLIEYLDKENQIENNNDEVKKIESFFNSDYDSINSENELNSSDIINSLDKNRGSQKLDSANFYMLNVSPSFYEMKHMENIAENELKKRGISNTNDLNKIFYDEQKNELMKMQLKLYTKDIMTEYAKNFNREIYIDESKLPNSIENKILKEETEKAYLNYLKENKIELASKENLNKTNEYVTKNNIKIIEEKGKSLLIEIDLKEKGKANVFIPKSTLHLQKDNSFKLPKNLYEAKEKEVLSKNKFIEIDYNLKEIKNVKLNNVETKIYDFDKKDNRFSENLKISFNEKDIKIIDKKFYVSEHLLNDKKNKTFENSVEKEYGKQRDKIYQDLGKQKGFDLSKRPLNEKDLLWYGKVETNRNYKHTDKSVKKNKEILKEIQLEKNKNSYDKNKKINFLQNQLIKDKHTNEIIKEGNLKGGNQYHVHVVVSRHDKTMKDPRNKISLSPLANAIDSKMENGAKVGFNRTSFALKSEKVFDEKFDYNRPAENTFENYNNKNKERKNEINSINNSFKNETKNFIFKHSGINEIKQEINPVLSIKKELQIANIPTQLPKSITQVAIKVIKKIISESQGLGY